MSNSGATPNVSVVVPVYNGARYIRDAVESILAQSFADLELVVVNDGSTDETAETLAEFTDPRLRILEQPNQGVIRSLNRGILESRGEYIAVMGADDISLPHRVEVQVGYLEGHPQVAMVGGLVGTIDEHGALLSEVVHLPITHREIWHALGKPRLVIDAFLFRRTAAIQIGLYNPAFLHAEDVEFAARMMSRYEVETVPTVVVHRRIHRESDSTRHGDEAAVNGAVVRKIITRYVRGQPFEATAEERKWAETRMDRLRTTARQRADFLFELRVGRERLRQRRWLAAAGSYARAARLYPLDRRPYLGLGCACLRIAGPGGFQGPAGANE